MLTSEVLREARALYESSPSHVAFPGSPVHGSYCVVYALTFATEHGSRCNGYDLALSLLERVTGDRDIPGWNANHTTAEVLAAFDTAIAWAEAMEQEFNINACTPVDMRRPDHAAFFLSQGGSEIPAEPPHPLMDQDAWERAWKDFE